MPKGSVGVKLSHDYCNFEIRLLSDQDMTLEEIDAMRKEAQRLADKAVSQYQIAKRVEALRSDAEYERRRLEQDVQRIREIPESEWTPTQKAKVKALADEEWSARFNYDYEDDYEIPEDR